MPTSTFFNLDKEKQKRIFNAAIEEFSSTDYEHSNISTIIKRAGIPRGSFYQYFSDKFDLYQYIFGQIAQEKLHYMSDSLKNPFEVPFLTLFKELYEMGLRFAFDNPKYVQIMSHLLSKKGEVFERIMKGNMDMAIKLYKDLIEQDKQRGIIRAEIDTNILAKVVYDMTVNISIDSLNTEDASFNIEQMHKQIDQVLRIFEKGIKTGE